MLTLICGIPNAGKTTKYPNALHLDEIGFIQTARELIKNMNEDVIIEGVFAKPEQRKAICTAYNGFTKCIFIDIPINESIRRETRNRPDWLLRNVVEHFEPPTCSEGWDEIEIIKWEENIR